ncbi:MAG: AEC family transporter [Lonepinella koalarum]|nr:AEC family transporter [Lonepinella koalarum]
MQHADFISSFLFSVSVTLPTMLMLILGIFLRTRGFIDDKFCGQATKIIFNITLPMLLFQNIVKNPVDYASQTSVLLLGASGTLILFLLAEILAVRFVKQKDERATFVQAVYRGNNGILGLAFCINAYGDAALAPASIYAAAMTFLYNILGVITLSRHLSEGKVSLNRVLLNVLKNPLIIAITLGVLVNLISIPLPKTLITSGDYLANMTLPLALLCTGASIDVKAMFKTTGMSLWASLCRVAIAPLFMVLFAYGFGLSGMALGILFLMTVTPMAAAAYAMIRAMGGNSTTAANIIGLTSFGSMFTSSIGLVVLSQLGWI